MWQDWTSREEEMDLLLWKVIPAATPHLLLFTDYILVDVENRQGSPSKLILVDLRTRRIRREENRTKERRHSRVSKK